MRAATDLLACLPASRRLASTITPMPPLAAGITGGLVSLYFVLLLWMTCWIKVEAFFEATPWLRRGRAFPVCGAAAVGPRPAARAVACIA